MRSWGLNSKCQCQGDPEVEYNEQYDAEYCKVCRVWLEVNCGDPYCGYCKNRPEKAPEGEAKPGE